MIEWTVKKVTLDAKITRTADVVAEYPLSLRPIHRPEIPEICRDLKARAVPSSQYLPKDPFTQRQILTYYPYMCNS